MSGKLENYPLAKSPSRTPGQPLSENDFKLKFQLRQDGVLIVRPQGVLRAQDFERLAEAVDPWIEAHSRLRGIMICIQKFPGWENFGSFIHHIEFVKGHQRHVRRVALVMDGLWPEIISKAAAHFATAEIKQFPFDEEKQALQWIVAISES